MQRQKKILLISIALVMTFVSCNDDDDNTITPISNGAQVEIRNTLQTSADPAQGGTGGAELPIETILGAPDGTYNLSATVSKTIEFIDYLEGLYDIDLSENTATFTLVAEANDPIYSSFFRTIEAGTFDRYYLTFPNGHNISSSSSTDSTATIQILSPNEIVVVISEGWNFNPGSTFTITLN